MSARTSTRRWRPSPVTANTPRHATSTKRRRTARRRSSSRGRWPRRADVATTQQPEPATTPGRTGNELLVVEDLKKHFPVTRGIIFQRQIASVKAVDGVSFAVREGETLGVVGE